MNLNEALTNISGQLDLIIQNLTSSNFSPEIVVAIITAIVALFTLLINKSQERTIKQRNLKEEKYITFLSALISIKAGYGTSRELIETIQIMNLIGSDEVVQATSNFIDLMISKKPAGEKATTTEFPATELTDEEKKEIQDERYNLLIKAMRKDLYGEKSNKNFPSKLQFVVFDKTDTEKIQELITLTQKVDTNRYQS